MLLGFERPRSGAVVSSGIARAYLENCIAEYGVLYLR
jgi:hypothetical protein